MEAAPSCLALSSITKKRHLRPSSKVDVVPGIGPKDTRKIRSEGSRGPPIARIVGTNTKRLIINAHGSLLDYSLLREWNPNTIVKTSMNTKT